MSRARKIPDGEEFRAMYTTPSIPMQVIAWKYGVCKETVVNTAKRMGLPSRTSLHEGKAPWRRKWS